MSAQGTERDPRPLHERILGYLAASGWSEGAFDEMPGFRCFRKSTSPLFVAVALNEAGETSYTECNLGNAAIAARVDGVPVLEVTGGRKPTPNETTLLRYMMAGGHGAPAFLSGSPLPRGVGSFPRTLDVDDGYPSERAIESVKTIGRKDATRWMQECFADMANELPCSFVGITSKNGVAEVSFSTGGWSGCEEFIRAVLGNFWLRRHLVTERCGGHYKFEVKEPVRRRADQ